MIRAFVISLFVAATAPLAVADRPNIIFILSDDQRADTVGFMGKHQCCLAAAMGRAANQ